MRLIVPIVEGRGEERAVPILVRRWLRHRRFDSYFDVPERALCAKGCGKLKAAADARRHLGIEHYVATALRAGPHAILVILDADKECLGRQPGNGLGPELLARAQAVAGSVPIAVVVANRNYEAWLLAGRHALVRCGLVRYGVRLSDLQDPEDRPGGKALLTECMGEPYSPPVHQPLLTEAMSFSVGSLTRSPSLAKLFRDLERLTQCARSGRMA